MTRARLLLAVLATAMLTTASVAAAEVDRDQYKAEVEPICKTNKKASDKYLKGVRSLVQREQLKHAGERFTKAAAALERAQKQLATVEKPAADTAKLDKWLAGIKSQIAQMRTIAKRFKAGEKPQATSLVVKLTHGATITNNLVVPFAFHYCVIEPGRYT